MIALTREVQFVQEVARLRRDLSELQEDMQEFQRQPLTSPEEIETMAIPEEEKTQCVEQPQVRPGTRCRPEGIKDKHV